MATKLGESVRRLQRGLNHCLPVPAFESKKDIHLPLFSLLHFTFFFLRNLSTQVADTLAHNGKRMTREFLTQVQEMGWLQVWLDSGAHTMSQDLVPPTPPSHLFWIGFIFSLYQQDGSTA